MSNVPVSAISVPDITEHHLIESYLAGISECVAFVDEKVNPVLMSQLNPSDSEGAMLGTFYRLHLVMKGVLALNDRQHFQLVVSAMRTTFELLIDLKMLANDPNGSHAMKFAIFPEVERFRVAEKIAEHASKTGAVSAVKIMEVGFAKRMVGDKKRRAKVEKKVRTIWGVDKNRKPKYPRNHWSDADLRTRAKSLGAYYEMLYLQLYSFTSWYAHSGAAGYAGIDKDGLGRVFGMATDVSRILYLDAINAIASKFHLTKVLNDFQPIMNFLKEAPKEILKARFFKEYREGKQKAKHQE